MTNISSLLSRQLSVPQLVSQMFSPSNLMAAADPRNGKFLTGLTSTTLIVDFTSFKSRLCSGEEFP